LTREDINIIDDSSCTSDINENVENQINELEQEEITNDALLFFSTLIKHNILSIKIAEHSTGGLFHDKTGCFSDKFGNSVSFRGSANETFMGWSMYGNFETLETFKSWDLKDIERVESHKNYLTNLWNDKQPGLKVSFLNEIVKGKLVSKSYEDIDDFRPVLEKWKKSNAYKHLIINNKNKRVLKDFQKDTLKNWKEMNFSGIIKHATGSGKTVTAISAIEEHISDGSPVIILVPSILLLKQWYEEILIDISDATIQLCGGGHSEWKKGYRLTNLLTVNNEKKGAIIIVVLDTMVSSSFLSKLRNLDKVLLVADEVHTLGSNQGKSILNFNFGKRLGLSATPERHRDPEGTENILNFFGQILTPVISIKDAIENGRLVNYLYEPIMVKLNEGEMQQWQKLTLQIVKSGYGKNKKITPIDAERIKMLFIKRSRVAKKASAKISIACSTIMENYTKGEHWLVYCEDTEQLNQINEALRIEGISPYIYKSEMQGSKENELLDYIKNSGIMLSIKCLDEGIDIPKISHAVIMASSQNPRQFIQRRGRVLRADSYKQKAVIFDLFAMPNENSNDVPDGLIRSELLRALEFSESSLNNIISMSRIRTFFIDMGLDLDKVKQSLIKSDDFDYEEN